MAIVNGQLDWATWIPGIKDKTYSEPNTGDGGIACHSWVGQESETQDGIPNRFLSTERDADGDYTPNAAASSMFVLRKNGTLIQMYTITGSTWTSGGRIANTTTWAVEAEGGPIGNEREPFTPAQEASFIRLCREWEAHKGRRLAIGVTLREHKHIAQQYGYAPTACASDRYAVAWAKVVAPPPPYDPLAALNEAVVMRFAIIGIGADVSEKGFDRLQRAHKLLKEAGLI